MRTLQSSLTTAVPFAGDFGFTAWYRFYRKDLKGKRVEATATGGPLFSGPQNDSPEEWQARCAGSRRCKV